MDKTKEDSILAESWPRFTSINGQMDIVTALHLRPAATG